MIHPHGLEVFVRSVERNQPFSEFRDPKRLNSNTFRWIAADPGDEYEIVIRRLPQFRAYKADLLQIVVIIDGNRVHNRKYKLNQDRGEQYQSWTISDVGHSVEGQRMRSGFAFGDLKIGEIEQRGVICARD